MREHAGGLTTLAVGAAIAAAMLIACVSILNPYLAPVDTHPGKLDIGGTVTDETVAHSVFHVHVMFALIGASVLVLLIALYQLVSLR